MKKKQKQRSNGRTNHIYNSQELPRVSLNYTDSHGSFSIESSAYNYEVAFNGALYFLDKRLKKKNTATPKDISIG